MKKIIIVICLFCLIANKPKAQVTDTIAYIQQIIANKDSYIGKPFSVLEKDLKLEIKQFNPFSGITWDISKETSTSFWFIKPKLTKDYVYPRIDIQWKVYLDSKKSDSLWEKNDGGGWTPEVDSFYAPGIIKDISILGELQDSNGNAY